MISFTTRIATLAVTALLGSALLTSDASAVVCKPKVFGSGMGPNPGIATNNGIQKWRMKVLGTYGAAFANWLKAQSRGRACVKSAGQYTCRVWGNPCN